MSWEDQFRTWAQPPSQGELDQCDNAVTAIQKAIAGYAPFNSTPVRVFAQGSFRNRTNVRGESDVDICVLYPDTVNPDLATGMSREQTGLVFPAPYAFETFRDDVQAALFSNFGASQVSVGNKAFDIHSNTYRVDADVVACIEHRRYSAPFKYLTPAGTYFVARDGVQIINWPQQNYDNGVWKNEQTSKRFKAVVRIMKNLLHTMTADNITGASDVSSYLVECLVWNVPNATFGHDKLVDDVRETLVHTFNATLTDAECLEWGEINELKYLFSPGQRWTRVQAHDFLSAAWGYLGFK